MRTRSRRRSGKGHLWLYGLAFLVVAVVVLLLLAPTLVMNWVRGYVQQEAFRGKLESILGTQLQGSVTLAPLRWTGDEVTTNSASATAVNGWGLELNGVHVGLDWNTFRDKKWHLVGGGVDSLVLERKEAPVSASGPASAVSATNAAPAAGSDVPGWLRGYLPNRVEIEGVEVARFGVRHPGPWALTDARLTLSPWRQGDASVQARVEGGILETPVRLPVQPYPFKFNLVRASLRLSPGEMHMQSATLHWVEGSEITASGHVRVAEGRWDLSTHLTGFPLRECVNDDWRLRLTGLLDGDLEITGRENTAPVVDGDLRLRDAVLTALPMLDRLATYTQVERFKRLVLDVATAHVRASGERRQFDRVILQSNGLLRLEGSLLVDQGRLEGSFMLGVTPETVKWIPGAQQHVFTSTHPGGPAGMLWTPLRISGTVDAPREDLSERILAGAGRAVVEAPGDLAGKGTEMLLTPVLGKEAAGKPAEVIKGATDAAGKAVDTGVKLLEGLGGGLLGK